MPSCRALALRRLLYNTGYGLALLEAASNKHLPTGLTLHPSCNTSPSLCYTKCYKAGSPRTSYHV